MHRYWIVYVLMICINIYSGVDAGTEDIVTWRDCVKSAMENHPDLKSAKEKINQAKAGVGITRSGLLPQIDANANISTSKKTYSAPGFPGGSTRTDNYSYGITGKQLLFDGTKSFYDLKSSQKKFEASDFDYQVTSSNVRLSLRNAFNQLLKAQEALSLAKEIAKIRKQNYELVQMRYRAGVEHKGSLLTAEANLAQAEFEVSQAERSISLARHSLLKEMGIKECVPFRVRGDLLPVSADRNKPDLAAIANVNPVLQRIIRLRESAKYDMISANTDYSPKVYGQVSADRTGSKWPPDNNEWSAGVQMTLNLFQGGKSYYQSSKSEAAYNQLIADEASARNTIKQALEQKWTNLQNYLDITGVQQKFLKAAEERANIANAQYAIGTIFFDNWIIIQDTLVNAKKNYLDAEVNALTSEAEWIQSKGGTLTYDE